MWGVTRKQFSVKIFIYRAPWVEELPWLGLSDQGSPVCKQLPVGGQMRTKFSKLRVIANFKQKVHIDQNGNRTYFEHFFMSAEDIYERKSSSYSPINSGKKIHCLKVFNAFMYLESIPLMLSYLYFLGERIMKLILWFLYRRFYLLW